MRWTSYAIGLAAWVAAAAVGASSEPAGDCFGDTNNDRRVNFLDLNAVIGNFGQSVPPETPADLNGDGAVNLDDLNRVLGNFGRICFRTELPGSWARWEAIEFPGLPQYHLQSIGNIDPTIAHQGEIIHIVAMARISGDGPQIITNVANGENGGGFALGYNALTQRLVFGFSGTNSFVASSTFSPDPNRFYEIGAFYEQNGELRIWIDGVEQALLTSGPNDLAFDGMTGAILSVGGVIDGNALAQVDAAIAGAGWSQTPGTNMLNGAISYLSIRRSTFDFIPTGATWFFDEGQGQMPLDSRGNVLLTTGQQSAFADDWSDAWGPGQAIEELYGSNGLFLEWPMLTAQDMTSTIASLGVKFPANLPYFGNAPDGSPAIVCESTGFGGHSEFILRLEEHMVHPPVLYLAGDLWLDFAGGDVRFIFIARDFCEGRAMQLKMTYDENGNSYHLKADILDLAGDVTVHDVEPNFLPRHQWGRMMIGWEVGYDDGAGGTGVCTIYGSDGAGGYEPKLIVPHTNGDHNELKIRARSLDDIVFILYGRNYALGSNPDAVWFAQENTGNAK